MRDPLDTMRQALRLTRAGDLRAATQTLQHALGGHAGATPAPVRPREAGAGTVAGAIIEGEFRVVDAGVASQGGNAGRGAAAGAAARARPWPSADGPPRWAPAPPSVVDGYGAPVHGDFRLHRFACQAGALDYKLFVPAGLQVRGAPLLVMLHGCTQSPDDFARGTRMNALAVEHGYVVAWPAQSVERNPNRCWNWFRSEDQQRSQGEPAMLAALTSHLVERNGLDARRVYVAGLSAGGAMAAVLAATHPDVYAAIGVHSGLATGLASDIPSAFAAMRKGDRRRKAAGTRGHPVPAIVFHGDGDKTVHPRNGEGVVEQSLGSGGHGGQPGRQTASERRSAPGGRDYTRTIHRHADGRVVAEHWLVHGSPHAWSGGDAAGSYTDPAGPDASAQMLRFFSGHRRTG